MSKGTKQYVWRCPPELHAMMEAEIALSRETRSGEPWTFSEFVRIACLEKVYKRQRSRGHRGPQVRTGVFGLKVMPPTPATSEIAADQVIDGGVDLGEIKDQMLHWSDLTDEERVEILHDGLRKLS